MRTPDHKYFWELDAENIRGRCILLDIDGTLVFASGSHLHPGVYDMVIKLREHNEIVLFSNGLNKERNLDVANKLGVLYVSSYWRKPIPFVMRAVPNPRKLPILVIGNLFLTDGLLAIFTRSYYIRVKRFISPNESIIWRLTLYWLDDQIVRLFYPRSFFLRRK